MAGGSNFYWNQDGTLYTGGASFSNNTSPGGAAGAYRYNGPTYTSRTNANVPGDYPFRYINNEGSIVQHILPFEANIPLDRSSVFGRASYDMSDKISAYAQVLGVSSKTRRYFTDSPAIGGWGLVGLHGDGVYAPSLNGDGTTNAAYLAGGQYGLNCAPMGGCSKSEAFPVSPELAALLDSRPDPEANWSFNYGMDFGDFGAPGNLYRSVFSETRTNQLSFGLEGQARRHRRHVGRRRVERHGQAGHPPRGLRVVDAGSNVARVAELGPRILCARQLRSLQAVASRAVSQRARAACPSSTPITATSARTAST